MPAKNKGLTTKTSCVFPAFFFIKKKNRRNDKKIICNYGVALITHLIVKRLVDLNQPRMP